MSTMASHMELFLISCAELYHMHIPSQYCEVIMGAISSQITSLTIVYSTVYSGVDQRKHQNSASRAFVRGTHRWPVNSTHKGSVTRKMFPFDAPSLLSPLTGYSVKLVALQPSLKLLSRYSPILLSMSLIWNFIWYIDASVRDQIFKWVPTTWLNKVSAEKYE